METSKKGLFASITPAGDISIETVGITASEFLTILAALEGAAERIIQEAE